MTRSPLAPHVTGLHLVRPWIFPLGVFFLLSVLIVLPFFWLGSASGHDFEFHAASWFDAAQQWKQGVLYPRWMGWANHGFGEPRFIFYPPLSWMLGALLVIVLPGATVPIVYIVLTQTFAGMSAYVLLRRLTAPLAALFGAACYVINANALLISYIRSDFAEQLACAIFPLLLLAVLRVCEFLPDSPPKVSSIALVAIPYAGIWLSNAPAAVIASYAMTLLIAWAAFSQRSWRILIRGASGLALGIGLACLYIVPAAYEQKWVNIGQALSAGLLPSENFLFTKIADPEHTWFNWIASICALALILLFLLGALASRRFAADAKSSDPARRIFLALLVLGCAVTLLTLRFTLPLWSYLPKLRFVQFPWRWMSIIALVCCCFLALLIEKPRGWLWFAAILALSIPLSAFLVRNTWWDPDEMPTQADAIDSGNGFEGTDEYDPAGDDHMDLPPSAPLAKVLPADSGDSATPHASVQVQHWSPECKQIRVDAQSGARIALRLLNYPAWRVRVNGHLVTPERMDNFNEMVIPVASGGSVIRVQFVRTLDRWVGDAISALSVLWCAILFWLGSRKRTGM
jgi:hypothetical protein